MELYRPKHEVSWYGIDPETGTRTAHAIYTPADTFKVDEEADRKRLIHLSSRIIIPFGSESGWQRQVNRVDLDDANPDSSDEEVTEVPF